MTGGELGGGQDRAIRQGISQGVGPEAETPWEGGKRHF